ncbi:VOC family protein [Streptomyces tremellae]|uniref:VOC family protein n=1 Tax=Streptomyces tremellae TaxID=1124239 RepID=A0ABP7GBB5_9ACTN
MAAFTEGTPCWLDVSLPDLEAGKRFYGGLFGWTFGPGPEPYGNTACATAYSGGSRVAALVAKRDGRMPTAWGVYFATPDAAEAARRVRAAGGSMVREPVAAGRHGVVALAADPGGAVFGLWQPAEDAEAEAVDTAGGGADVVRGEAVRAGGAGGGPGGSGGGVGFGQRGRPGSFCWTEVYTRLPEPVDAFYERVLRVSGSDVPGLPGETVPFRMWSPKGATPGPASAVAGRSVMTDAFPAALPGHFLNYFSVADCDAATSAAVRLGGRVRHEPFDIPYGRMAVLTDDQGADFGVLADPDEEAGGDDGPGGPPDPSDEAATADAAGGAGRGRDGAGEE